MKTILFIAALALEPSDTDAAGINTHAPHHTYQIQHTTEHEVQDTLAPPIERYTTSIQWLEKHHPDSVQETVIYFLFTEINNLRESKGLCQLTLDKSLTQAAQQHAQWLAKTKKFQHKGRKDSTSRTRAQDAGYPRNKNVGENIGKGYYSIEKAMQEQMASMPHLKKMLDPTYTHVGIFYVKGVWVRVFGE